MQRRIYDARFPVKTMADGIGTGRQRSIACKSTTSWSSWS
jgi:hypothetical protein